MQILKKLLFLISPKEQKKGLLLLIMILLMALIEVIGVASIVPFMSVLVNPSLIETNFILINLQPSRILMLVFSPTVSFLIVGLASSLMS